MRIGNWELPASEEILANYDELAAWHAREGGVH